MSGPDGFLTPTAAAVEHVAAARREVAGLLAEVEGVGGRLRATADIPWSGEAARAWRGRVEDARIDVTGGVRELGELHELLTALLQRLRL